MHCLALLTINTWMKGFIGQLLDLIHSQWIFRNITKHHHTNGIIKLEAREMFCGKWKDNWALALVFYRQNANACSRSRMKAYTA